MRKQKAKNARDGLSVRKEGEGNACAFSSLLDRGVLSVWSSVWVYAVQINLVITNANIRVEIGLLTRPLWQLHHSDNFGRSAVADLHDIIDVITHGHEQVKEQFATILHLHLHGSTPLESLATSNDQG